MFDLLSQKFNALLEQFGRQKTLSGTATDPLLSNLRDALLEADVPLSVANAFTAELRGAIIDKKLPPKVSAEEYVTTIMHEKLTHFLGGMQNPEKIFKQKPATILVMGLQGSGKTTTIAKLARWLLQNRHKRLLVSSVDFQRPAAIEQLEILAKQVGIDFFRPASTNVRDAVNEIIQFRQKQRFETLILDTAGRMHVQQDLLAELQMIRDALHPTVSLLVFDAMTGQESLNVAKNFHDSVGFTGAIVTKMDSGARVGAALAFKYSLQKPILFIGTGEKIADLELFHPHRVASRIIGMGDIEGLIERTESAIQADKNAQAPKLNLSSQMTLNDFAQHLEMMGRMGSLSQIMRFIPGAAKFNVPAEVMEQKEQEIKKFRAIIYSMTPKERTHPKVINQDRGLRIARGAGVSIDDVHKLLQSFKELQSMLMNFKQMPSLFGRR